MSSEPRHASTPVADMDRLPPLESALICCLRMVYEGDDTREALKLRLTHHLGAGRGASLLDDFTELCETVRNFGRRPLMRRRNGCRAAGADECAFAAMVAAAATGAREDAMLIAVCLVRTDVSPQIVALAEQVGLALMVLASPSAEPTRRRLH